MVNTVVFRHKWATFTEQETQWTPLGFVDIEKIISRQVGELVHPEMNGRGLGSSDRWTTWTVQGRVMQPGDQWEMQLQEKVWPNYVYSNSQAKLKVVKVVEAWHDRELGATLSNCVVELLEYV